MTVKGTHEKASHAFLRFGLSGLIFTMLGPGLFWLAYPLGPFVALAMAELLVHAIRFFTYRHLVFPAHKGYRVSLLRYVFSALPVTAAGLLNVALLRKQLDRISLTLTMTITAAVVGFLWSRYVFNKPITKR